MTNSDEREAKHARSRRERYERIKERAEYVRTHPDEDRGDQVNDLANSQTASARHFEHERPDVDELRDSPLLDE